MTRYNSDLHPDQEGNEILELHFPVMYILLFSSLLSCCDMGIALNVGGLEKHSNLNATIGGEGALNPAICVVLFGILQQLQDRELNGRTVGLIIGLLFIQVLSILIGVAYGFACCLLFKHLRFLSASAVTETFFVMSIAILAYFTAQGTTIARVPLNGPLCIYVFSIIAGHINWYNLSPQGKATTGVTYAVLGRACKAACFCYIGLSVYPALTEYWGWYFIGFMIPIIVIGRLLATIVIFYGLVVCFRA